MAHAGWQSGSSSCGSSDVSFRNSGKINTTKHDYKPVILRSISLLSLLLYTGCLIGLLEYAARHLPHGVGSRDLQARGQDLTSDHRPNLIARSEPVIQKTSAEASKTSIYESAPVSDYLSTAETTTPAIASSVQTGDYVPTANTQQYATEGDYVPTIVSSAGRSDYVPTKGTTTPLETTVVVTSTSSRAIVSTIRSHMQPEVSPFAAELNSVQTVITSYELVPVTTTKTPKLSIPTATSEQADTTERTGQDTAIHAAAFHDWDDLHIFLGTFLAVLLAVLYRILLSILHTNFVLIDPFRQMLEPGGALADRGFFSFYHDSSIMFGPLPAVSKRRWAVAVSTAAYMVTCLIPALSSEVLWVDTNWQCPAPGSNAKNPCPPRLTTTIVVVRVLQGLLGFTGAVIIGLWVLMIFSETGLPADPSSIATVSSLMRHPGLAEELNELPVGPNATLVSMQQTLKGRKYGLGHWKTAAGATGYGIYPRGCDTDVVRPETPFFGSNKGAYSAINTESSWDEAAARSHTWIWTDPILLFVAAGTFGVVLAWRFTTGTTGFNGFFGSDTFGPRFILTGAATILANLWSAIEQSAMVMAPYVRLSQRPARPRSTICFAPTNTPILSTWRSLRHGYFFVALATLVTLLSEALSIVISGVPYHAGQTFKTWLISEHMSLCILGIMIIASIVVILHRRGEPKIPVLPETLGVQMVYLSGSTMLDDFDLDDGLRNRRRDEMLERSGKWYEFRPMLRSDGRKAWLVDEAVRQRDGGYQAVST